MARGNNLRPTREYRLSKFQQVLPDRWQTEMIGAYLLDFDGAAGFVTAA
jgi:hypothetical protein